MPDELRARLVETGVALVAAEGTEALSLREIARRAGVSHGAPRWCCSTGTRTPRVAAE
ncbi:TetR family transcriptional regulator, partial [Actinoplanes sp. NPDC005259]|uniref:TetR family transcriptional regulator n=1 Tax=Actinoplanes sp. NPDC005259 TaxID=3154674 RepID=UPI0033B098B4